MLQQLAASPWSVVLFVGLSLVITRALDAGLKDRLPKSWLPWVSMVIGMAGEISTALLAGLGWSAAVLKGFAAGAGGVWSYSAIAKYVPGVKAADREKGGASPLLLVMMLIASMLASASLLTGCPSWSWQKEAKVALTSQEAALATADKVGLDYYQKECRAIAAKCPPGSDEKTCADLGKCWTRRRLYQKVLDRTALALASAWTACAAGDQEGWKAKLQVVEDAMADLSKMLGGAL